MNITWIVFWALCFLFWVLLGAKIEAVFKPPSLSGDSTLGAILTAISFFVIVLVFPIAVTYMVEFPSLIERPTVVTFSEEGEPVFHKWGLLTPSSTWDTMEVANVPECERPWRYSALSETLFERDGKIYSLQFEAEVCPGDLTVYYSDKSRRRQGNNHFSGLSRIVLRGVYLAHSNHEDEIKRVARGCEMPYTKSRGPCPEVAERVINLSRMESFIQQNGLKLDLKAEIMRTDLID